ncbi:Zinc finger and BTB domain-containing protein 39 [Amphibalanus amphitrite]|uniref:Zinc finger and BTB domain-containing protein 39 n=1 Tax=Amphibalanus amphitrite TaxID=1232801 RepID=A0A6A4XAC5_AMPAM|nr:Zinc finger and BTB domain-containing protein 39 [Amphibalanus amphitrite]
MVSTRWDGAHGDGRVVSSLMVMLPAAGDARCDLCEREFVSTAARRQHVASARCFVCGQVACGRGLQGHLLAQHRLIFPAKWCPAYVWRSRRPLYRPCGVTGPFTCPLCGGVYRHVDSFRCHLHVHAGKTQCHLCQRVFSRRTRLNAHLSSEHGLESAYSPRVSKEP